jgi:hypothetical protein
LLAHIVVLSIVGFSAPKLAAPFLPQAPPIDLWLAPRLTRQADRPTEHRASAVGPQIAAPAPKTAKPQNRPAPAPAPIAAPAAPATTAGPGAPTPGVEAGQGVRQALRSRVGCDLGPGAHLTHEEKDRCDQHFAETAKLGPKFIDTIPPEKRAYYDAVQQAYQAMNDPRTPTTYGKDNEYHAFGHLPALGCGLKFGGPKQKPDHSSFTDKIKATGMVAVPIGPLRCGVVLPQGSWTPELGIPVP